MPHTTKCADGCLTDPEPGMDSRQAAVRNMRSKCRCSCVLQFTFRRAVSCVLHRPPSQVIHCIVLFLSSLSLARERSFKRNQRLTSASTSHHGKGSKKKPDTPTPPTRDDAEGARPQSAESAPRRRTTRTDHVAATRAGRLRGPRQTGGGRHTLERESAAHSHGTTRDQGVISKSEDSNLVNDPSAGSPTETLLRLLLPLNAQVWKSSRQPRGVNLLTSNPNASLKRSIGSSDGRCVQRAGT